MTLSELFYKIFGNIPTQNNFDLFSWQYFLLLLFEIGIPVTLAIVFRNKEEKTKNLILKITAYFIIVSYVLDFFLQKFWAGGMIPHKLPFHICTATGILLTFVTFSPKFDKIKTVVTVWAVISPLLWMIFPFNTYNSGVSLFSYSKLQPILYHTAEFFWGLYMLTSGKVSLEWKKLWQPIVALFPMAAWAAFGQELYFPNEIGENFLMLKTDTTGICPHWVFLIALFLGAALAITLVYLIYNCIVKLKTRKPKQQPQEKQ